MLEESIAAMKKRFLFLERVFMDQNAPAAVGQSCWFLFFLFFFSLKDVICKMGIIYGFGGFSFLIVRTVKKICTFSCNSRCIFKLRDLLVMYTIIVM